MAYTRDEKRERARTARRLLGDAGLAGLLTEIEQQAATALLASGGDPERLRGAWALAQIPDTLRACLQARIRADEQAGQ